jgi:dienelactone hydrolase
MRRGRFFATFICIFAFAAAGSAQTLEVVPDHVLVDETAAIRASGLQPGEHVSIEASLTDGAGAPWKSAAEFAADAQGVVDTSKQAPVKGSYDGISPIGLVLFMKAAKREVADYTDQPDLGSQTIQFQLMREGKPVATAQLVQIRLGDGVRQFPVILPVDGTLFLPKGSGPFPGVLVLGGSECGVPIQKAAWLASHGYAAMALAYCGYDNLPKVLAAIPLEYFGHALDWMKMRMEIESDRIGVLGTGRGAELALQLGSMYPQVKAVVAYAPANVLFPSCCDTAIPFAWTWKGQQLDHISVAMWRNPMSDPKWRTVAQIPVEHTQGPIMLIAGGDDKSWPSTMMAAALVARLNQFNFAYRVDYLKYDHAGHDVGRPEFTPGWIGQYYGLNGATSNHGGSAAGDVESTVDSVPKVLEFLNQSLNAPPAKP